MFNLEYIFSFFENYKNPNWKFCTKNNDKLNHNKTTTSYVFEVYERCIQKMFHHDSCMYSLRKLVEIAEFRESRVTRNGRKSRYVESTYSVVSHWVNL